VNDTRFSQRKSPSRPPLSNINARTKSSRANINSPRNPKQRIKDLASNALV